jgi:hypothetical protein
LTDSAAVAVLTLMVRSWSCVSAVSSDSVPPVIEVPAGAVTETMALLVRATLAPGAIQALGPESDGQATTPSRPQVEYPVPRAVQLHPPFWPCAGSSTTW